MSYMKWLIPASNYVGWWTGKWSIYPRRIFTLDRFLGFVHFLKPESQDLQCYWLRNTSRGHNYLRIFSFPNLTIPLHYLLWRNGYVAGFCTERFRCEVHFGKILYSHAINLSEGLLQSVWRRRVGGGCNLQCALVISHSGGKATFLVVSFCWNLNELRTEVQILCRKIMQTHALVNEDL